MCVDADALFVGFVSLCKLSGFIFCPYDAWFLESAFLLCQEPKGVADMFLGGSFLLEVLCCQHPIVIGNLFRWTWCIFDVGGESFVFVGGNIFKANQFKLSCFSFVGFSVPYLNPILAIQAPAPSVVTGCHAVPVVAAAAAFL